jgi:hypothetical protein
MQLGLNIRNDRGYEEIEADMQIEAETPVFQSINEETNDEWEDSEQGELESEMATLARAIQDNSYSPLAPSRQSISQKVRRTCRRILCQSASPGTNTSLEEYELRHRISSLSYAQSLLPQPQNQHTLSRSRFAAQQKSPVLSRDSSQKEPSMEKELSSESSIEDAQNFYQKNQKKKSQKEFDPNSPARILSAQNEEGFLDQMRFKISQSLFPNVSEQWNQGGWYTKTNCILEYMEKMSRATFFASSILQANDSYLPDPQSPYPFALPEPQDNPYWKSLGAGALGFMLPSFLPGSWKHALYCASRKVAKYASTTEVSLPYLVGSILSSFLSKKIPSFHVIQNALNMFLDPSWHACAELLSDIIPFIRSVLLPLAKQEQKKQEIINQLQQIIPAEQISSLRKMPVMNENLYVRSPEVNHSRSPEVPSDKKPRSQNKISAERKNPFEKTISPTNLAPAFQHAFESQKVLKKSPSFSASQEIQKDAQYQIKTPPFIRTPHQSEVKRSRSPEAPSDKKPRSQNKISAERKNLFEKTISPTNLAPAFQHAFESQKVLKKPSNLSASLKVQKNPELGLKNLFQNRDNVSRSKNQDNSQSSLVVLLHKLQTQAPVIPQVQNPANPKSFLKKQAQLLQNLEISDFFR